MGVTVLVFAVELQKVRTKYIFSNFWEKTGASFKIYIEISHLGHNVINKAFKWKSKWVSTSLTSTIKVLLRKSKVAHKDKTLPRFQNTSQNPKTLPRIQKHFPESKPLPRIQNTSQNLKHFPESKPLARIQSTPQNPKHVLEVWDSCTCFGS